TLEGRSCRPFSSFGFSFDLSFFLSTGFFGSLVSCLCELDFPEEPFVPATAEVMSRRPSQMATSPQAAVARPRPPQARILWLLLPRALNDKPAIVWAGTQLGMPAFHTRALRSRLLPANSRSWANDTGPILCLF